MSCCGLLAAGTILLTAPEHKVNRIQTKHSAAMNTASKNNRNNVIGASRSLAQRRTNELNIGFASRSFEAPHFVPRTRTFLFITLKVGFTYFVS
jgi:hypothetical protein